MFFLLAYQKHIENFCNTSKINQSINSSLLSDTTSKKSIKIDKMKVLENDENSKPTPLITSKKTALHR